MCALGAAAACGSDSGTGPRTTVGGIKYTARVELVEAGGTAPLLSVVATLTNTTGAPQMRTYPAGCPVRILLYRQSDNTLVYDERTRDCAPEPTATVTIDPLATADLQSGIRFPATVAGDSLPFATYKVRAAVMTEGAKQVLIDAGTYFLTGS
ncbi:MAG TPA: hypothetical protein VE967_16680 [Gemmatimonadaceae bacterium]|nr:hypothetical protein [Gemmatimonadaceae bacterium]